MWQQHLLLAGPVLYPLLGCSLLALALVIERLWTVWRYPALTVQQAQALFQSAPGKGIKPTDKQDGITEGLYLLQQHRLAPKALRDELLSHWLLAQRQRLHAHLRGLMLIGALAPLLGLLGTVLGIIGMFQNVAHHSGPVTPALLASGMWEAMITTALGLAVAIPALAFGQGLSIWADRKLESMQQSLNQCSLALDLPGSDATAAGVKAPVAANGPSLRGALA